MTPSLLVSVQPHLLVKISPAWCCAQPMSFKKDNPYSILILAIPFIVGGIILLLRNASSIVIAPPGRYTPDLVVEVASVNMVHAAGVFGVLVGTLIIWFYFRIRND